MKKYSSRAGFTLVELLVVISIILVASSVIFIGGSGGDGAKLTSAQRILSGVAQGARGQAILKGQRVRLIIYDDSPANEDDEKRLRFVGLVYEETEDSDSWIAATQGTYLPDGIYFNKRMTEGKGWSGNTMSLEYPRAVAKQEGTGEVFNYYEFNSDGTMASGFSNNWLVLQAGSLRTDGGSDLKVMFGEDDIGDDPKYEKARLLTALIFRRSGSTAPVNDPAQINPNLAD